MSKVEDSLAALENRDWSKADVDTSARKATVIQSVRMSRQLTERLFAEAERRGTTPSQVIRDLVEAGLTAAEGSETVRVADVHRVIDALTRRKSA